MTQEKNLGSEPPRYPTPEAESRDFDEKTGLHETTCERHGASQTPHLDAQLQSPSTKARIQELSQALADAVDENRCSRCAIESAALALNTCLRDLRLAKKNGQWTKEEKKALKKEMKGLMHGMKHEMKKTWKQKPGQEA